MKVFCYWPIFGMDSFLPYTSHSDITGSTSTSSLPLVCDVSHGSGLGPV